MFIGGSLGTSRTSFFERALQQDEFSDGCFRITQNSSTCLFPECLTRIMVGDSGGVLKVWFLAADCFMASKGVTS